MVRATSRNLRFRMQIVPTITNGAMFMRGRYGGAWTGWHRFTTSAVSDYRTKENIRGVPNALNRLALLKPILFKYKPGKGPSGQFEGFVAHELADVLPYAVTGKKDAVDASGNPIMQSVDLQYLTPLLTRAVQELNTRFVSETESLKAQLKAANDNYQSLRALLDAQGRQLEQLRQAAKK